MQAREPAQGQDRQRQKGGCTKLTLCQCNALCQCQVVGEQTSVRHCERPRCAVDASAYVFVKACQRTSWRALWSAGVLCQTIALALVCCIPATRVDLGSRFNGPASSSTGACTGIKQMGQMLSCCRAAWHAVHGHGLTRPGSLSACHELACCYAPCTGVLTYEHATNVCAVIARAERVKVLCKQGYVPGQGCLPDEVLSCPSPANQMAPRPRHACAPVCPCLPSNHP